MKLRQKFLEWLYAPQFLYELYSKNDVPKMGETVYITCGILENNFIKQVYWNCKVEIYNTKFKYLRKRKIIMELPYSVKPHLRIFYGKDGKILGSRTIWYGEKEAINENGARNYIFP